MWIDDSYHEMILVHTRLRLQHTSITRFYPIKVQNSMVNTICKLKPLKQEKLMRKSLILIAKKSITQWANLISINK